MLHKINLEDILFLDIETVPQYSDYSCVPAAEQTLWEEKTQYLRKEEYTAEEYYNRAGIWAAFGRRTFFST